MGTIEEIKRMQQEGRSDKDITVALESLGIPQGEINEAFAQARIKQAVTAESTYSSDDKMSASITQEDSGMIPSVTSNTDQAPQQAQPQAPQAQEPQYQYEQQSTQYSQEPQYQYEQQSYDPYSSPMSSETITDIAEQVVSEKMGPIKNKIEEALSFKTMSEAKINYLDERLKRIEKIIDRLQLSILQKVGEYVTNVEDLKNEVIETQKSFKSLWNEQHSQKQIPKNPLPKEKSNSNI